MISPLPRLREKPLLLAEALFAVMVASLLIKFLPFRSVARVAAGRGLRINRSASSYEARLIARAVSACAARVPWRALCIQKGLAAVLMLRRRRLAATLFYGAAHSADASLVAHVWVRSNNVDVMGCETANDYGLLAAFPGHSD